MNDELRAVRERLRPILGAKSLDLDKLGDEQIYDLVCIAWNDLEEHPAEDDSAITPEWLESIGLYRDGFMNDSPYTHRDSSLYFRQSRLDNSVWDVFVEVYDLGTVRTRGDVRRLLAALGIEVPK